MSGQQPVPPPDGPPGWSARVDFAIAAFMFLAAVVMYFYLTYEESKGGGFSGHAVVVLLYQLGGKWLVSGVCIAMGTLFLILGIRRSKNSDK